MNMAVLGKPTRLCTPEEKDVFIKTHNNFRCMHGAKPLTWDEGIAVKAAEYIYPLTRMKHDDCLFECQTPSQGENLYWNSRKAEAEASVVGWYSEVHDCKGGQNQFTANDGCMEPAVPGRMVGHFTALIWDTAARLGCAFSRDNKLIICRYAADEPTKKTLSDGRVFATPETPNVGPVSNFAKHVFPKRKEESECGPVPDHGPDPNPPELKSGPASDPGAGSPGSYSPGSSDSSLDSSSLPGLSSSETNTSVGKRLKTKSPSGEDNCDDYPSAACNHTMGYDIPKQEYPECPGANLDGCMAACPSLPTAAFGACAQECANRCSFGRGKRSASRQRRLSALS